MYVKEGREKLVDITRQRMLTFFPMVKFDLIESVFDNTLDDIQIIFENLSLKYKSYIMDGNNSFVFSMMNTNQYSILLYLLSKECKKKYGSCYEVEAVYYLNKIMHSNDWFYDVELPALFYVEHPLGSVMGRAKYGDRFFFYQGCTVGASYNVYPVIGENVLMWSYSSIIGDSHIGNNVIISTGTRIINDDVPDNCIVFGKSPNLVIKQKSKEEILERLRYKWDL